MSQYGVYFQPSAKHLKSKDEGLSLIKDMLLHETLVISSNCPNLYKEMESYSKDDKGLIPKINDHLIDALRYALISMNYNMHEMVEAVRTRSVEETMENGRFRQHTEQEEEDWHDIYDF
jgi:hypothetical protein